MSLLQTYKATRRMLLAPVMAVAVALGCALPAMAWASVSESVLGVNVQVPSTAQHAPQPDGSPGKGSESVLGVNLLVPDPVDAGENPDPDGKPGDAEGSGTSGASAVLGVNLELPSTSQQAPSGGSSATGSEAVLGVNLAVPDPVDPGENPNPDPEPGEVAGPGTTGSEAVLGVNLNVPSTITQDASTGKGSEAVLGVNLAVQNGIVVSFDAMNGRNTGASSIVANMKQPIERPSDPEWPGRTFAGWYTDAACTDGNEWKFADDSAGEGYEPDLVGGSMTLYAKWEMVEPRETGRVVLHMGFGNTVIDASEAGSHGIVGDDAAALGIAPAGYVAVPDGDAYASAEDPTYQGNYFLGGKGNAAPELDGTLDLPTPRMFPAEGEDGDGRVSGVFVAWRTEEPVKDGDSLVYAGDSTAKIGRFDTGIADEHGANTQHFWAQWMLTETYDVTFHAEGGVWPNGSTDPWVVPVPGRQTVSVPANPTKEGHVFKGWCTKDAAGTLVPFNLRNPIEHDLDLYARWSEDAPDPPDRPDPPADKLDVTVPVSVTFAIDAETGEVMAPEMGAYAIKSRSAVAVAVERLEAETLEAEAGRLLSLAEGAAGWEGALRATELAFRAEGDPTGLAVPLAGAGGTGAGTWLGSYELSDAERDGWYSIEAFDPASGGAGDEWWLTDACNRLPLELGMRLSDLLEVRHGVSGPVPVTHLKVTVSAR